MLAKCALLIAALVPTALGAASADAITPSGLRERRDPLSGHTRVHGRRSLFGSSQEYAARLLSLGEKRQDSDRRRRALPRRLGSRLVEIFSTVTVPRIGSGIEPHGVRVVAARFRVVNLDIDTGPATVRVNHGSRTTPRGPLRLVTIPSLASYLRIEEFEAAG